MYYNYEWDIYGISFDGIWICNIPFVVKFITNASVEKRKIAYKIKNSGQYHDMIMADIKQMQYSTSYQHFQYQSNEILKKWTGIHSMQKFQEYFFAQSELFSI